MHICSCIGEHNRATESLYMSVMSLLRQQVISLLRQQEATNESVMIIIITTRANNSKRSSEIKTAGWLPKSSKCRLATRADVQQCGTFVVRPSHFGSETKLKWVNPNRVMRLSLHHTFVDFVSFKLWTMAVRHIAWLMQLNERA
jgi:hypothetical protein